MTTAPDNVSSEMQLGIDLRERGERLIVAAEAFAQAAKLLFRLAIIGGVLGLAALVAIAVVLVTGTDTRQKIIDCVQPTGQCYQRGQQQTRDAVSNLDNFTAWVAACAADPVIAREPLARRGTAVARCAAAHLPKSG